MKVRKAMTEKIRAVLDGLAKRYGSTDPRLLAERLGLPVVTVSLPDGINGMYCGIEGRQVILLADTLPEEHRAYCLAHELGHALLHPTLNAAFLREATCFVPGKYEREADLFAAALLLYGAAPEEGTTAQEIAAAYGLPEAAVRDWAEKLAPRA